jgi:hypothetical protein
MLSRRHMPRREDIVIEQFYRKMLWASAYPLLLALMAGATWVDRIYSHSLRYSAADSQVALATSRVADRLLLLSLLVVVAGVLCAWLLQGTSRRLVVASLAVFSLEFLVPVLVVALPGGQIYLAIVGPVLRVGIVLVALGLSLLATRRVLA